MRSLVFVPPIYAGASGAQCRLTAVIPLLLAIFFSSIARAQTVIPPATSWRIKSTSYCDFNTQYDFISPWPGDSPIDVLKDYVAFLDGKCGGSAGGNLIVTHTLNACTPTIDVVGNGTNPAAAAIARYCTYRRHVDPKPGCTPAWACQPWVSV